MELFGRLCGFWASQKGDKWHCTSPTARPDHADRGPIHDHKRGVYRFSLPMLQDYLMRQTA